MARRMQAMVVALVIAGLLVGTPPAFGAPGDPGRPVNLGADPSGIIGVTPDGTLIYEAREGSDRVAIYAVPIAGGTPRRLSGGRELTDPTNAKLTPDGTTVVTTAEAASHPRHLFAVDVATGDATDLTDSIPATAGIIRVELVLDGTLAIVHMDEVDGSYEVFAVPVDDSAPLARVAAPLPAGRSANQLYVTPDADHVVYRADADTAGLFELYSAPLPPSATPVATRLNTPLGSGRRIELTTIRMSSDGQHVVYGSDEANDEEYIFYTVPADGSASPAPLLPQPSIDELPSLSPFPVVSDDGRQVAFATMAAIGSDVKIWVAPIDGSGSAIQVATVPASVETYDVSFTPDGSQLLYGTFSSVVRGSSVRTYALFAAPVDGSGATTLLGPTSTDIEVAEDGVSADSAAVVVVLFEGVQSSIQRINIASGATTELFRTGDAEAVDDPVLDETGSRVLFGVGPAIVRSGGVADRAGRSGLDSTAVYSVPVLGGTPVRLDDASGEYTLVRPYGDRALYVRLSPGTPQLFSVRLGFLCRGRFADLVGTSSADALVGTRRGEVIVSGGGDDTVDGRGGADTICAGRGADEISGGRGADRIDAGAGRDELSGGGGDDELFGRGGRDSLAGGRGDDTCNGGRGRDVARSCATTTGVP